MTAPSPKFSDVVSAEIPDQTRESIDRKIYQPSKKLIKVIRDYQALTSRSSSFIKLLSKLYILKHRLYSVICGADIPLNSQIGLGILMPHPNGIVIHPKARIGVNCLLFQQVTIGAGPKPGFPEIGGHVDIGAGAKILGGIKIGDHVRIGANAVVVDDVPSNSTAVGIPAKIIKQNLSR